MNNSNGTNRKNPSPSLLYTQCAALSARRTPLHMPGHKRRTGPVPGLPYAWDLTEIDGADDLHGAQGILAEAMARTAALCGARRSWYLVNGSTVGLLAGIRALAPRGSTVLAARNCHKAVYHAVELGGLAVRWLVPPLEPSFGVYGSISPARVAAALRDCPQAACVVLTSPTFDGVLSDIASIAEVCHAAGKPLLVDEAHGAHLLPLALPHGWRGGAVAAGADLVVQSAHKTLPSLTQTALLHLAGPLADPDEVERQLDVFETSSPSYPLMASLDGCTGWLAAEGPAAFARWRARLSRFDAAAADLRAVRLLSRGGALPAAFWGYDDSKIEADIGAPGAAFLRQRGFEPEMVCGNVVLALTSPCDADDTLDRYAAALRDYDALLCRSGAGAGPVPSCRTAVPPLPAPGPARCTIADALDRRPAVDLPAAQAAGRVAAEYVWAYPPGVPLLAPGEEITPAFLEFCRGLNAAGTRLRHTASAPGCLRVLA